MAMLLEGIWCPPCDVADLQAAGLEEGGFHDWVTRDGGPGPTGQGGFAAEPGRYHLFVSLACPFAHRALLMRRLKQLEEQIGVSVCAPRRGEDGWEFEADGRYADSCLDARLLQQVYREAQLDFSGRVSVPVLWDRERRTIVNNDSGEIMRMLDTAFGDGPRYAPPELLAQIDALNQFMQARVNAGVYACGLAADQASYDLAIDVLFGALDELDARLGERRYLLGSRITESDWRLFTTLVRFDSVYVTLFKTNLRRIADYPNLSGYLRDLYQQPGVRETVDLDYIKLHYFHSYGMLAPRRIVPRGPTLDLDRPHGREHR